MGYTLIPLAAIRRLLGGLARGATPSTTKPPEPKWRVVDTKHPTEDVVVAGFSAQDFGAKGDGISDDTTAFQNALDAMAAAGGGTVFAPEGRYAIRATLNIPTGVTLRGEWRKPEPSHRSQARFSWPTRNEETRTANRSSC